jgi:hypothetical protein
MSFTPKQIAEIHREISNLSDDEIERRLAASLWPDPDKRRVIELYLENRKRAKQGTMGLDCVASQR